MYRLCSTIPRMFHVICRISSKCWFALFWSIKTKSILTLWHTTTNLCSFNNKIFFSHGLNKNIYFIVFIQFLYNTKCNISPIPTIEGLLSNFYYPIPEDLKGQNKVTAYIKLIGYKFMVKS